MVKKLAEMICEVEIFTSETKINSNPSANKHGQYKELFAGIGFMIIIAQRLIRTIYTTIQQIFKELNIFRLESDLLQYPKLLWIIQL